MSFLKTLFQRKRKSLTDKEIALLLVIRGCDLFESDKVHMTRSLGEINESLLEKYIKNLEKLRA